MDNSLIVGDLNIPELSDDELAERLKELGFHPGPILSTTRSVYQRKLARLLRNETFIENYDGDGAVDDELRPTPVFAPSPGTGDSSPSTWNYVPDASSPSRWNASTGVETPTVDAYTSGAPFSPGSIDYDDLRRRPLPRYDSSFSSSSPGTSYKPWSPDDIVTQATPPPQEPEQPLLSPLVKLALLVGIVLFVVFVYYNMESTPVNPFTSP